MTHRDPFQPLPFCDSVKARSAHFYSLYNVAFSKLVLNRWATYELMAAGRVCSTAVSPGVTSQKKTAPGRLHHPSLIWKKTASARPSPQTGHGPSLHGALFVYEWMDKQQQETPSLGSKFGLQQRRHTCILM